MGAAAPFTPRLWARHPVLGYQPVEAVPALHTHSEGSLPPSPCRLTSSAGQHLCLSQAVLVLLHISAHQLVGGQQPAKPQCVFLHKPSIPIAVPGAPAACSDSSPGSSCKRLGEKCVPGEACQVLGAVGWVFLRVTSLEEAILWFEKISKKQSLALLLRGL